MKHCSKCGSIMEESIIGCDKLSSVMNEYEQPSKRYRKDNGEEIKVRMWRCINYGTRTKYNWFQINILGGYAKYEDHDTKAEYINNDNPNAIIL